MDIQKFIEGRPYLYHLTSKENAKKIVAQKKLYSTNRLIDLSDNPDYLKLKRERRIGHKEILIKTESYFLRDQRPISELALSKCLTHKWGVADFLEHLNERVFMWPTLDRLWRHYDRYAGENPVIFRFSSKEIIGLNNHAKFCRLNSGATRANSYLGGKAPERGPDTFLSAKHYDLPIGSIAEVTFEKECNIDCNFHTSSSPEGVFKLIT
ncbi:hypothetical protein [Flavihumibacter sp. ZG627]|uniref:DUF7002 family protein n=1 Tax=Flavihumibacter sp. ZG627 TaxID=1463156 RepID=UPI0012DFEFFB|nr:hypothetical protein [Flavihumibacter sp. ZG627]